MNMNDAGAGHAHRANRHEQTDIIASAVELAVLLVVRACPSRNIADLATAFAAGKATGVHL